VAQRGGRQNRFMNGRSERIAALQIPAPLTFILPCLPSFFLCVTF